MSNSLRRVALMTLPECTPLKIVDWGKLDYEKSLQRQVAHVDRCMRGDADDTLVFVEHPRTVTLGRRATDDDLHFSAAIFQERGVCLQRINRGGMATAHEPGQLVVYPLVSLKRKDVRWYCQQLLQTVVDLLADYSVVGCLKAGEPGVWVGGAKICSFGVALKKWVSSHGIAINLNNDLVTFSMIVPCGRTDERITSLKEELGKSVDIDEVKKRFVGHFCRNFGYRPF
ncbi:lipoyl(octanoyl) transferase LipB [Verrucomicrobia bacterium]|nr:lipoyl(octanoyl) transferase LipB [Verrucomicrobiota bacterium]